MLDEKESVSANAVKIHFFHDCSIGMIAPQQSPR
jgi:hypothetical protein